MSNTKQKIVDIASELLQKRVFSAFSYQDISSELGMSKAAIHNHYRTKELLGNAVLDDYLDKTLAVHAMVESTKRPAWEQLEHYIRLIREVTLEEGKGCLAVTLQVEHNVIPESMQKQIKEVFAQDVAFLTNVLAKGLEEGSMTFRGEPKAQALVIVNLLQIATMSARMNGEAAFDALMEQIKLNLIKQ
ncbi:TetR/AcrR family transcriptional regulator [Vibrio sp. D404a]|uniref:TetR/AcrR family transcriptional regulator n=1 Tax=unclassified Vibrio TaxID=2614977 RepID=UPI00255338B7|nr:MULTISPECIES: TetR/AcrR family transcriptional regulator [unclassified Vibrio]MDK9735999.1 TetR/AcrR family transcriptional regulator [Vibrio sp. D404a]MDK9797835.1 TetR/AcrR family transcriptional regulator [Vibrio sp. D449a]